MSSSFNIALSGINAATTRATVSANNIANQSSTITNTNGQISNTPYVPQRVDQISISSGGVIAQVSNATPAATTVANSSGGTSQVPNVDPANELLQQNVASYDLQANLKTIQTQNNIFKSLLDIVT